MINILCYGDSNTYGYDPHTGGRYDESVRWPCRLQTYLGDEYHLIEAGLNPGFENPGSMEEPPAMMILIWRMSTP